MAFPAGVLHGWYFSEPSLHLQAVSEEYQTYRHDDNLTCHWADPELGLDWPDPDPVLSPAAEAFGGMGALLQRLGTPAGVGQG